MATNKKSISISGGYLLLLGIVLVILKAFGVINWSWLWVTLPFWFGIALILITAIIWIIYTLIQLLIIIPLKGLFK
jgi:hypothetical protein